MDLGVALPTSGPFVSREAIIRVAQEAERLGFAGLWTYERLLYPNFAQISDKLFSWLESSLL